MSRLTRRSFMKWAGVTAAYGEGGSWRNTLAAVNPSAPPTASTVSLPSSAKMTGEVADRELAPQEIYRLLGFATMTGEDPLKVWQRLRSTKQWRVGPLAPDAWSGCVFVADDADIFAFRTLSLPQAWLHGSPQGNRAEYCGKQFEAWFSKWAEWWKQVGPKAPDNS